MDSGLRFCQLYTLDVTIPHPRMGSVRHLILSNTCLLLTVMVHVRILLGALASLQKYL